VLSSPRGQAKLMRIKKLTEIMQINGVRVYAHWSVLVIGTAHLIRRDRAASRNNCRLERLLRRHSHSLSVGT